MTDLVTACRSFLASEHYFDATPRQLAMLGVICDDAGPHHVSNVAAKLGVQKPAVTRAVDALANRGLVKRVRSDTDRREVFIFPTRTGDMLRKELAGIVPCMWSDG